MGWGKVSPGPARQDPRHCGGRMEVAPVARQQATSSELAAEGKKKIIKSCFDLQTAQIGEESHQRQLNLEC